MKTENNLHNKEAFFVQYYGQFVARCFPFDKNKLKVCDDTINHLDYLILEDLSNIHPSYAMIVGKIVDENLTIPKVAEHHGKLWTKRLLGNEYGNEQDNNYRPLKSQQIVDLLRSKGYALPWRDLSVQELIDYGWIKIKYHENKAD